MKSVPVTTTPELLTVEQAAAMAGVGKRSWWRFSSSGRAPAPVRIGRCRRWVRSELVAWIEARCPRVRRDVGR